MPTKIRDWDKYYKENEIHSMPWYHEELDHDVDNALRRFGIKEGVALDLGTGPGTQAMALSNLGFQVTGSDLSYSAIEKAKLLAESEGREINFVQDDILDSKLKGPYDFVIDRGCFHVLDESKRDFYMEHLKNIIKPQGYLLLKCFSHLQPGDDGPHRLSPEQISDITNPYFEVESIEETYFHGTMENLPKALFCVLKNI